MTLFELFAIVLCILLIAGFLTLLIMFDNWVLRRRQRDHQAFLRELWSMRYRR